MSINAVTVGQLNLYIKSLLEGDSKLSYISIVGEISNFKSHFASGHMYFTLRDENAAIKCVMFRGNASKLRFVPKDGMKVVCSGRISVYERDGVYQLYAENMVPDGEGDLMAALEKIKEKLSLEGLFDTARKKPIPPFPKKVAVITSETGAAVKDIFNVLSRRYPLCDIIFCPATVQGALAPKSLISALDKVSKTDADVIIIGRGGGSIEDLWCFNDEALARKIAEINIPIISAVGHETDFTICDFVADLRAPTPSAAAELAVPDSAELYASVLKITKNMESGMRERISARQKALSLLNSSPVFSSPIDFIVSRRSLETDRVCDRVSSLAEKNITKRENEFINKLSLLEALNPIKTILRGFAVCEKQGKSLSSVKELDIGDKIELRLSDGSAECTVEKIAHGGKLDVRK